MIHEVIHTINQKIIKVFEHIPGAKVYGVAQTMIRRKGDGSEFIPALVDKNGEGKYVGIDDVSPVIIYHKINSITAVLRPSEGYGDSAGKWVNTYNNSLIAYLNRKKLNITPDELFLYLQAAFPEKLKADIFDLNIKFTNVNLSSVQVWAAEYQRDFALATEANLFAVNYTIESSFKKDCFDKCIEQ